MTLASRVCLQLFSCPASFSLHSETVSCASVENVGIAQLGLIKKFEQDKDSTTITAGDDVDMEAIAERCEQLRASIEATKSEYEKEKMQVSQAYCDQRSSPLFAAAAAVDTIDLWCPICWLRRLTGTPCQALCWRCRDQGRR